MKKDMIILDETIHALYINFLKYQLSKTNGTYIHQLSKMRCIYINFLKEMVELKLLVLYVVFFTMPLNSYSPSCKRFKYE